jgi:hypothetical protein
MTVRDFIAALALVALLRFLVTPTWPCAFVALGMFALAVGGFVMSDKRHGEELARIAAESRGAAESARSVVSDHARLEERIDRIERARAFGG